VQARNAGFLSFLFCWVFRMKLYELAEAYSQIGDALIDSIDDDGAVAPDVAALFSSVEGDFKAKLSACCRVVRTLEVIEGAIKAEVDRLQNKKSAAGKRVDSLKSYMKSCLEMVGEKSVRCDELFTVAIQANPPSVQVDQIDLVPSLYDVAQERRLNLKAILSAGGAPGCQIVRGTHLRIR
jgi:hypothetical protein